MKEIAYIHRIRQEDIDTVLEVEGKENGWIVNGTIKWEPEYPHCPLTHFQRYYDEFDNWSYENLYDEFDLDPDDSIGPVAPYSLELRFKYGYNKRQEPREDGRDGELLVYKWGERTYTGYDGDERTTMDWLPFLQDRFDEDDTREWIDTKDGKLVELQHYSVINGNEYEMQSELVPFEPEHSEISAMQWAFSHFMGEIDGEKAEYLTPVERVEKYFAEKYPEKLTLGQLLHRHGLIYDDAIAATAAGD